MFRVRRSLIALFCLTLAAGCMSDDISGSNQIGDSPEGRAALMSAIEPGRTTISEVIALYGKPVAKNPQGGRNMQANFSSYSGTSGYSAVQYNADTGVIYRVENYRFDAAAQRYVLEARKDSSGAGRSTTPNTPPVAQAKAQVIVSNATPFALTSVSISPCGKRTPDAMAPKETIEPGQTRAFAVQPGCYDYHAWGYELGRLLGEVSVTGGTVNVGSGTKETVTITSALKK